MSRIESPLAACVTSPDGQDCTEFFKQLKNPYFISDSPALTQASGWIDAWSSKPSAYVVAAANANDVAAAVNFARNRHLRLVVKGGGHSYLGTSNAPDSLLIWTRAMHAITLHDSFVAEGCAAREEAQPAVTVEAGALWGHAYDAVTTRAGRYVQGGGCMSVGVAGLVQSGGFGSFSKNFGTAAAALVQAEVVTADGVVRIANACTNPELFWGLKGGGGGSLGVVTKLTLRTRELPDFFGAVRCTIKAASDAAFRALIDDFIGFYAAQLMNPHWGEIVSFHSDNTLTVAMVFQGLNRQQAADVWQPFFDKVAKLDHELSMPSAPKVLALPARKLWDAEFMLKSAPGVMVADERSGADLHNVAWAGDMEQAGQFLYGYHSMWMPKSLLALGARGSLVDALFAASRHWSVSLHFNKGLAGAPAEARSAARQTAMNPAAFDAFALAIIAGNGPPAFAGVVGHEPDVPTARRYAKDIERAAVALGKTVPNAGSYVSESNFFEGAWQRAYWGENYARLLAVKRIYDPTGLFFVHHGVGSEEWSADGFARIAGGAR